MSGAPRTRDWLTESYAILIRRCYPGDRKAVTSTVRTVTSASTSDSVWLWAGNLVIDIVIFEICIHSAVFNIEKYDKNTLFNNSVLYYH